MTARDGQAAGALQLAIELVQQPSQVRLARSRPLPNDIRILLHIASGDEDVTRQAARRSHRSPAALRQAAIFFLEQVLLYPNSDSYRVLGAKPDASYGELRRNMALLLRWLHPDSGRHGGRAVFASRVTEAWDHLKTKHRRAAYDRKRAKLDFDRSRTPKSEIAQTITRRAYRRRNKIGQKVPYARVRTHKNDSLFRRILMLLFSRVAR
jgi:hypothetical protein